MGVESRTSAGRGGGREEEGESEEDSSGGDGRETASVVVAKSMAAGGGELVGSTIVGTTTSSTFSIRSSFSVSLVAGSTGTAGCGCSAVRGSSSTDFLPSSTDFLGSSTDRLDASIDGFLPILSASLSAKLFLTYGAGPADAGVGGSG